MYARGNNTLQEMQTSFKKSSMQVTVAHADISSEIQTLVVI